jgi:hypothetical protein
MNENRFATDVADVRRSTAEFESAAFASALICVICGKKSAIGCAIDAGP